jgi:RimJ/RimL family protein N-acetyltransferase
VLRHPDPPLSDGVITLRAKTRHDVDTLVVLCSDPAIPAWTRVPSPYTREDALDWIAVCELELAAGRAIDWLAVDEHDEVLASVAVQSIDGTAAEVGYWVAAHARGRGVATRAVRLVCDWSARELELEVLELMHHEDNPASRGVARAAGFTESGETHVPAGEGLAEGRYVVHTWRPG